jgi:hypothetical protein
VSHREHAQGTVERGNDWLDGALAGWLLFIAIHSGQLAWFSVRDGGGWTRIAPDVAAPLLALAAIFPLLRFQRIGWLLAVLTLTLMAVREAMVLAGGEAGWKATAAFLAVNVLGLAYLVWIIPEFWPPKHADAEGAAPAASPGSAASTQPAASAAEPVSTTPAEPTPVEHAMAAIHQRIVAAGSACAVTSVSIRAEAGRFGVTPGALRTEGLTLYRTFLRHFMADGTLSPDEERELICLERALDLDDDGVWRLRAEAGLVGGPGSPAPAFAATDAALQEPRPALQPAAVDDAHPPLAVSAAADEDERTYADRQDAGPDRAGTTPADRADAEPDFAGTPPMDRRDAEPDFAGTPPMDRRDAEPDLAGTRPMDRADAEPDPSAQADITSSLPRIHSPGTDAGTPAHAPGSASMPGPSFDESPTPDALADYEQHELSALLAWAGIATLPGGAAPRTALERLRALHRTSTEPLDACASDHPLEPGEQCLSIRTVELYRVPPDAASAGPAADLPGPVLEPRSLVDGSLERERDLSTFQRTGTCRFLLTERRLLLVSRSGQQSPLPLSQVLGVRPFRNGLEVRPRRGRTVFLAFADGVDDVAMRVDRAVRDLRA